MVDISLILAQGDHLLSQEPRSQEALKAFKDNWNQHSQFWDRDTKREIIQHIRNGAFNLTKSNVRKPSKHKLWLEDGITFATWIIFRSIYDMGTLSKMAKARLLVKYPEIDPFSWISPSFYIEKNGHNGDWNEDDEDIKGKAEKAYVHVADGHKMLQVTGTRMPSHHHHSVQIYRYQKKGDLLKRTLPDAFDGRIQKVQKTMPGAVGSSANLQNPSLVNPSHRSLFQSAFGHKNPSPHSRSQRKAALPAPNFAEYVYQGLTISTFGKQIKVQESIEDDETLMSVPRCPEAAVKADSRVTSPMNLPQTTRQTSQVIAENPTDTINPRAVDSQPEDHCPPSQNACSQIDTSQTGDNEDPKQQLTELQSAAYALGFLVDDLKARVSRALESFEDEN
ncbi:hypothetical protein F53441_47 [Fusarium austroafricanum]|uniref:Uncharacterized protein n=1 Tax=Fusarium austroafricanum TaxID=2364996 RepID=A0A8H4KWU4_9HYPO|nr:hypothetical protein F53441_47 [Fusarium austroafricanum]